MKYRVTLKISYKEPVFVFNDRLEAMDFMETAWAHRVVGDEDELESVKMELVEEEATNEDDQ
jgi:hypothetical protein